MAEHPHSKFLVCNEDIDHIIGYVDSKDLLNRVLANQSLALNSGVQIRNTLIVPDTLTLSEALESFKTAGEDFAVIMNEYAAGGGDHHPQRRDDHADGRSGRSGAGRADCRP
ncbi:Putative transporter [Escherichia coli]|uniref:Transporter n=1 Tax=Escherichia coli TaxID=562 RepID=A0A2X3KGK5_ECOLX|nr:Putative transporter [Escherichia coli]